jgi:putative PIN family toxin of toxin-antitoxin system
MQSRKRERVVLDTNVIISSILSTDGAPASIVALVIDGIIENIICQQILDEVLRVLYRKSIQSRLSRQDAKDFIAIIATASNWFEVQSIDSIVEKDPDDHVFIACALATGATIISGDKHLLTLDGYQGLKILSARDFLDAWD